MEFRRDGPALFPHANRDPGGFSLLGRRCPRYMYGPVPYIIKGRPPSPLRLQHGCRTERHSRGRFHLPGIAGGPIGWLGAVSDGQMRNTCNQLPACQTWSVGSDLAGSPCLRRIAASSSGQCYRFSLRVWRGDVELGSRS